VGNRKYRVDGDPVRQGAFCLKVIGCSGAIDWLATQQLPAEVEAQRWAD
jgi:hypothetical protein